MTEDPIKFYVRHRDQISRWAALRDRVDRSMRDAVTQGSHDTAMKILAADSGDAEVDFYVRNRALITEWDALQTAAGATLNEALLTAAAAAGCTTNKDKRGWTTASLGTPELDALRTEHRAWVEMAWTKQDLLSTRRGYPFPRIALVLHPDRWVKGDHRDHRPAVVEATRNVTHELGMTKRDTWWVQWRMLDAISDSEDVNSYAARCVGQLKDASERIYPPLRDAIETTATHGS